MRAEHGWSSTNESEAHHDVLHHLLSLQPGVVVVRRGETVEDIRKGISGGCFVERSLRLEGRPGVVRQSPGVFLYVGPSPVKILPAHPEGESVVPLSPGAAGDIPGASPGQDGDRLLMVVVVAAAAVGVFEDSAGVRLRRGLPGSGDGREVRVFPEGDAPAVAPGGGRVGPAEVGGVPGPLPAGDRGGVLPGPAAVVVTGGPGATARPEPLWRVGPGEGGGESQLGPGWARAGPGLGQQ